MTPAALAWLLPIVVSTVIGLVGYLLRNLIVTVQDSINDMEASFTRIAAELATETKAIKELFGMLDRRVVRLESWREMFDLAAAQELRRRHNDPPDN